MDPILSEFFTLLDQVAIWLLAFVGIVGSIFVFVILYRWAYKAEDKIMKFGYRNIPLFPVFRILFLPRLLKRFPKNYQR